MFGFTLFLSPFVVKLDIWYHRVLLPFPSYYIHKPPVSASSWYQSRMMFTLKNIPGQFFGHVPSQNQYTFRIAYHLPQHFLYFFPLPQGQGSFRPIFTRFTGPGFMASVSSLRRLARSASLGSSIAMICRRIASASMLPSAMALRMFGPREMDFGTRSSGGCIAYSSPGVCPRLHRILVLFWNA